MVLVGTEEEGLETGDEVKLFEGLELGLDVVPELLKEEEFVLLGIIPKLELPPPPDDLAGGDFLLTNHEGKVGVFVGRGGIYFGLLPVDDLNVDGAGVLVVTGLGLGTLGVLTAGPDEPPCINDNS